MTLDKSIAHGKEHRKPYRGSKSFDRTCRNHGSCAWCRDNRLHGNKVRMDRARRQIDDADDRGDSGNDGNY